MADFIFEEGFILMKVFPQPQFLTRLCLLKPNNVIFDLRQGVLTKLSMQLKLEHNPQARRDTPPLTTYRMNINIATG